MAHDSQLPKESQESSTGLSKQRKTCSDVVLDWLRLYAAMPYMRGEHEITEEVILFYTDAFKNLKNPQALHWAWDDCRSRIRFLPQVPDLLEAYGIALEKLTAKESEKRKRIELCGNCCGTGWKKVLRPDGKGEWAVACECRKVKSA